MITKEKFIELADHYGQMRAEKFSLASDLELETSEADFLRAVSKAYETLEAELRILGEQ